MRKVENIHYAESAISKKSKEIFLNALLADDGIMSISYVQHRYLIQMTKARLTILARGVSCTTSVGKCIKTTDIALTYKATAISCVKILVASCSKESVTGLCQRIYQKKYQCQGKSDTSPCGI